MRDINKFNFRKNILATAIATTLGTSTFVPQDSSADIYGWTAGSGNSGDVLFTMLDNTGAALSNTAITTKGANTYQTPTSGTLTYDTVSNSGTATIAPFFFFGTTPEKEAAATGITVDRIPAGLTPSGTDTDFLMANMLFNWNGVTGIPVSLVWDASAIFDEMDGTPTGNGFTLVDDGNGTNNADPSSPVSILSPTAISGVGGIPASDGTYVGGGQGNNGYLDLGPSPLATLHLDTQNTAACTSGNCLNVNPSADINKAVLLDTSNNPNDYDLTTPTIGDLENAGIGGYPMQDGPFAGNNANFEFINMTLTSFTDTTPPNITLNAHVSPAGTSPLNLTTTDTYTEPGASCTDAPPLNTTLTATIDPSSDTVTNAVGTYNVIYNCTDGSGNTTQITRVINVQDANFPVITLNADSNGDVSPVTHECATPYNDAGASCTDTPDGPITPTLDTSSLDVNTVGNQTVTWSCTDSSANTTTQDRTVNVVDTTAPAPINIDTSSFNVNSSTGAIILETTDATTFTAPPATTSDSCDSTLTTATTADTPNFTVPTGEVVVNSSLTYTATDASNNSTTAQLPVEVHRSEPVITLVGNATQILSIGDTYTEQGITVTDEQSGDITTPVTAPGTDPATQITVDISIIKDPAGTATPVSSIDTSTVGLYEIRYTATDVDGNTDTDTNNPATTRSVEVTAGFTTTGSNFTMLDANGVEIGGTGDVIAAWDGSLLTSASDPTINMTTLASALPTPFKGAPWYAHDARVFGPGTYTFNTCNADATPGPCGSSPKPCGDLVLDVPTRDQDGDGLNDFVGAHILFDWNGTTNIDVVILWERDGTFVGSNDSSDNLGAKGQQFTLASIDADGDGIPGQPMADGPFCGSNANFNLGPKTALVVDTSPKPHTSSGLASLDPLIGSVGAIFGTIFAGVMALMRRRVK